LRSDPFILQDPLAVCYLANWHVRVEAARGFPGWERGEYRLLKLTRSLE
jgi:hypothetical protein